MPGNEGHFVQKITLVFILVFLITLTACSDSASTPAPETAMTPTPESIAATAPPPANTLEPTETTAHTLTISPTPAYISAPTKTPNPASEPSITPEPTATATPVPSQATAPGDPQEPEDPADDHANNTGGADFLPLEQEIAAAIEYERDVDFFHIEAIEGNLYRIELSGYTAEDIFIEVYDNGGFRMSSSEDCDEPYLYWQPRYTGPWYIAVEGWETGAYTLSVSLIDDQSFREVPLVELGRNLEWIDPELWSLLYRQARGEEVPAYITFGFEWAPYEYFDEGDLVANAIAEAGGVFLDEYVWRLPTSAVPSIIRRPDVYVANIVDTEEDKREEHPQMDKHLLLVMEAYWGGVPADQAVLLVAFSREDSVVTYIYTEDPETRDAVDEWLAGNGLRVPERLEYEATAYSTSALLPLALVDPLVEAFPDVWLSVEPHHKQGLGLDRYWWPGGTVCFELRLMAPFFDPEELRAITFRGVKLADLCCFDQ